ncbi:MAG: type III pantothenate kinase [Desulfobacterales bacterium]|nr:type III pantothenate kinase [Desulfobacterales bacterium]
MLLVIDVGNTNTVMGLFDGDEVLLDFRIRTESRITEDEFNILVSGLFKNENVKLSDIKNTIISSVVPQMMNVLEAFCNKYLGHKPHWVDHESVKQHMPILYDNPLEVGADRIVNSVAAYEKYKKSLIIIDFGTATTLDVISEKGEYLGGVIIPGVMISSEALFQRASKLPRVDLLKPPASVIGKNTADSIKSGIIHGYASMVDGMVKKISKEGDLSPKILATGGLAPLINDVSETIEKVESSLTLEGLRIISKNLKLIG